MIWMNLAKQNKPNTEEQILYDATYKVNLKKLNSQNQKVRYCLLEAEVGDNRGTF